MLDWTTSFLSDETIIKLRLRLCQILSMGLLGIVAHKAKLSICRRKTEKSPASRAGLLTKTNRGRQLPKSLEINPDLP
jgi:hypothetical protein